MATIIEDHDAMGIRWFLYRGLIDAELARTFTSMERKQILRNMLHHELPWRQAIRAGAVPTLIAIGFVLFITVMRYWAIRNLGGSTRLLLMIPLYLGIFGVFLPWIARARNRLPFVRSVRDFGHEVCIHCGYWLRGLDVGVKKCPECGKPREPMPDFPRWVVTGKIEGDEA